MKNVVDIHTHTIASGHGTTCTIADMAKQAAKIGLKLLGISDHGPATPGAGRSSYFRSLSMAPHKRCGISLLYGVELNITDADGHIDLDEETLSLLDYAIISMHPQTYHPGDCEQNTRAFLAAMHHPKIHLLGHCDDVKYPVDYARLVAAAKNHQVFFEVNNASLAPDGYRGDTRDNNCELLRQCALHHVPVILSSDSHGTASVGDIRYAQAFVTEQHFPEDLILNDKPELLKNYLN